MLVIVFILRDQNPGVIRRTQWEETADKETEVEGPEEVEEDTIVIRRIPQASPRTRQSSIRMEAEKVNKP